MSLAVLSGKVGKLSQDLSGVGTTASTMLGDVLYGKFPLRNEENIIAGVGNAVGAFNSLTRNISSLAGVRPPIYTIGEIPKSSENKFDSDLLGGLNNLSSEFTRAVATITGDSKEGNTQRGVIIDGFNQMKGQMSVALPEQPVQYKTSITNTRVRLPILLTMRVYINNLLSDNILDDLMATAKNAVGGLASLIIGNGDSRASKGLISLEYIQQTGAPFKIYNPHKVYNNMMIQDIHVVTDETSLDTLVADVTFKENVNYKTLNSKNSTPSRTLPTGAVSSIAQNNGWF